MVAFATNPTTAVAASQLDGPQRQQLAVAALAGDSISELARQNEVSRKFVYRQKEKAQQALKESFTPSPADEKVLFDLLGEAPAAIGVKLLDSMLMTPTKSVSGIRFPTEETFESCQLCPMENCPNRRAPYDESLYERKYCPAPVG